MKKFGKKLWKAIKFPFKVLGDILDIVVGIFLD